MARPDKEAIDTFMSITRCFEAAAIQKLEENNGNLNEAVNAYFSENDGNIAQEAAFASSQDDVMDVDDQIPAFTGDLDQLSLPDPNITRVISGSDTDSPSRSPFVLHEREVREFPIEFKDGIGASGSTPIIEDVSENAHNHGQEIRETVILDDDDDKNTANAPITHVDGHGSRGDSVHSGPSAPTIVDVPDYSNDIEEEMIRAAIEASKHDTAMSSQHDHLGGISSVEHDEAVMHEAAMLGVIHEGRQLIQNDLYRDVGSYPRSIPHPPSPSLTAQRLIREQQDDEYLAALQADREKELKAKEEAEAALAEERRKRDEICRKQLEEQEIERQLADKEASLPQEPTTDDENAVTLLVRMPDGSNSRRRFRKSDKIQDLFDFIDVGRKVKPGSYRLVRAYPKLDFGDRARTLNELGLTKQEAFFLELI